MIAFPKMAELVPEGVAGKVTIEHFKVDSRASESTRIRELVNPGRDEYVPPGVYARLTVDGQIMMSDVPMEWRSNTRVIDHATGHVLIAGLGLGMILHPMAAKPEVASITVVEKSADVIKLVGPTVPVKVGVVEGDIFTWTSPKGVKYDTIYFDIWPNITTDNLPEMARLHRRFGSRKSSAAAFMDSWQRAKLQVRQARERRNPWNGMVRCGTFKTRAST